MTRPARPRLLRLFAATALGSVLLTGCQFDVYELPLPGGASTGDDPMTVTAQFRDVLDLVPKSTVKVDDVTVGEVTKVQLQGYDALVTMKIDRSVDLPDNAIADIRQTSLLGEKFVSLSPPLSAPSANRLGDGDEIDLQRTGRNPEVEEVFGALSLVLNGGGVAQLKTIATELNKALDGREDSARSVLNQISTLTGNLADRKQDIVRAIESLNRLALSAKGQQRNINLALDELPSAISSIDRQRDDLVKVLQALNRLGNVGVRVISASKASTIETVRQLQPVLTELANSGDAFVKAFSSFLTFPFVDEVVGRNPQTAKDLAMGDYTNLSAEIDLSGGFGLPTSLPTLLPSDLDPTKIVGNVLDCLRSGNITSKACQKVLSTPQELLQLRTECRKSANKDVLVCQVLNAVPGLPPLGGLPGAGAGASGGSGGSAGTGNPLGGLGSILGGALGLNRPGLGLGPVDPKRGPTLRQMTEAFDPSLVRLLVPGMMSK
ncbi:MCE family protein [Nocardioides sp. TRM66260-LWL]|uniref:MCE family protein n=1 Tax=Nocardioides sp. TRM66260-LWL TaxID=2874478 RepID=UPI001CC7B458|nr:MCE family protein [Nocardioides sp. TRM66260-LWL]MBZ5735230.1 MCE family protein [Nocardioides sp. TRM66260-LWL]